MSAGAATIVGLGAWLACGLALRAGDVPEAPTSPAPSSPELESILTDWASRDSRIHSGNFEWRVLQQKQIRSPTFGALSVAQDALSKSSQPRLLRTRFDANSFRLEGDSVPIARLSQASSNSSIPTNATAVRQFHEAMAAQFTEPVPVEEPQPYVVRIDPQREVHFWAAEGEALPRGVVLAADQRNRSLDEHSLAASYTRLLDALRLAVRPSSVMRQGLLDENCRVLPQQAFVEGRPCLVIDEPNGGGRSLIDPSRGSLVVRRLLARTGASEQWQYDIDYDRKVDGVWMPVKLNILCMNEFGDPYNQISVIRESGSLNGEAPQTLTWDFPPGTLVTDGVADEQYLIRADGTRRTIAHRIPPPGLASAEWQPGRAVPAASSRTLRSFSNSVGRTVIRLLTWPWILFTLPMIYAVSVATRAGFRNLARRGQAPSTGMDQDPV